MDQCTTEKPQVEEEKQVVNVKNEPEKKASVKIEIEKKSQEQVDIDQFDNDFDKLLYLNYPNLTSMVSKDILKREKEALIRVQQQFGKDQNQLSDEFFKKLKECMGLEVSDDLALQFCYINTKKNRKTLIEELAIYRPNYLLLVPFQCRLVASICKLNKILEEEITKYLIEQYRSVKPQENYAFDKKQRFVRYICELTKFLVIRQDVVLDVFQTYIDDLLSKNNIQQQQDDQNAELSVIIIENCGKFLLKSQDSYKKFKYQLEQLAKLRRIKPLTQQLDLQLENALSSLDPRTSTSLHPHRQKTQLEKYIKFLFFDQLNAGSFSKVAEEMLKLPFQLPECQNYVFKYLVKLSAKGRFSQMDLAAGLIQVLKSYYPLLVGQIVDNLLEELQLGLEDNQFNLRQKRITVVKFLGEFYNYNIIDQQLLFTIMYLLIEYGHSSDIQKHNQDLIDPPDDTFRITQTLTLIETVKSYIKKFKNPLLRYLIFFQRYTLSKDYLPQLVEFNILDLYEMIDPNLQNIQNRKQAEEFCLYIKEQEQQQSNVNYEEELKKKFGSVQQQDTTLELFKKRRKEEEEKEANLQKQLAQEIESQFNRIVAESQQEQRSKINNNSQPMKKTLVSISKGTAEKKVLQRTTEVSSSNNLKKQQKVDYMCYQPYCREINNRSQCSNLQTFQQQINEKINL